MKHFSLLVDEMQVRVAALWLTLSVGLSQDPCVFHRHCHEREGSIPY
jgi:hypothetical protein